jgi:hypothetical protein
MLVGMIAPITARDRLMLRAAAPLGSRVPQTPLNIGLLDGEADQKKVRRTFFPPNARNQLALF